jgi:hypothetical protein
VNAGKAEYEHIIPGAHGNAECVAAVANQPKARRWDQQEAVTNDG